MKGWTLEDIPWESFDPGKVDADLLKAAKAASMVEHNGADYETYLHNVFADDPEFKAAASAWARDEVRHGLALARWARLADPDFDFEASFQRFRAGYRLPLEARRSVRGSRAGELVARCVVEAGTSSFYTAIHDRCEEPVLKKIVRMIAADEVRHYKLFYGTLQRYLERERLGGWRRLKVALGRLLEGVDDELAFAYYCGNDLPEPYRRRHCSRAYERRAYYVYRFHHLQRLLGMTLKAAGLKPYGRLGQTLSRLAWRYVGLRRRFLDRVAA